MIPEKPTPPEPNPGHSRAARIRREALSWLGAIAFCAVFYIPLHYGPAQ